MLKPDWNQERPPTTVAAIRDLWEDLRITACAQAGSPVEQLLNALRMTHVNGGAAFAMFSLESNPALHWFISRNRWEELELPEQLLMSHAVTSVLPEVCREPVSGHFGFECGSAFTLAGELAQTLSQGGAYEKHEGGPGDAFTIADEFRKWLFQDRFDEMLVLKSFEPWSAWFHAVAWDGTWLIVDKRSSRVSVLAVTDTY